MALTTTPTTTTPARPRTITVDSAYFTGTIARCAQCGDVLCQYIDRDERGIDTARCLTCGALHEAATGRFLRGRYGQMGGAR